MTDDSRRYVKTRHPGVYRKGSRYIATWRDHGRLRRSSHRTLAEALEAKSRALAGQRTPTARVRFDEYAAGWLALYRGRTGDGLADSTRGDYERSIEAYIRPFFRGYTVAEIAPRDVRRFVAHLHSKGLAPGSIRKNLAPLKLMLTTAIEDGIIQANPAAVVRVGLLRRDADAEPERAKAMTRDELRAVLDAIPPRWAPFFGFLAFTGVRISEALGADWEDVEFGVKPTVSIRRQYYRGRLRALKTRNSRRVLPLTPHLARTLWRARPTDASGPIFHTRTGGRLDAHNMARVLRAALEGTDLTWVTPHTFRHTMASMLFEGGGNVRVVSSWLGHADPAFTLRTYVHLLGDDLEGVEFLDPGGGTSGGTGETTTSGNQPQDEGEVLALERGRGI